LFWLIVACAFAGAEPQIALIGSLMGALAGFLVFNMRNPMRRKASIFLGDAGSMSLGLSLAYFCIALAHHKHGVIEPISVAWILALPIIDTCAQFYRRVREGRHPFAPDRGHFHHHFIHAGIPVGDTTPAILALAFIMGAIGYMGVRVGVPEFILTVGWIALLFTHMALSRRPALYILLFSKLNKKRLEKKPPHVDN
jgi:UDP-GlcNAc:undecaprenyl-phosphate/decaprenyl-phosphate GlcNAc-1-phosphate transferase